MVGNTVVQAALTLALAPIWVLGFGALVPGLYRGDGIDFPTVALVAGATATMVATQGLQAVLIGGEDIRGVALANLGVGLSWGAISLGAARVSYLALLLGWLATQLGLAAFFVVRSRWRPGDGWFNRGVFGEQLRYGRKTLPGSVSRALNMRAGLYVASMTLSREAVGVYGLILTVAEALLYLPSAFGQVILGSAARRGSAAPSFRSAYIAVAVIGAVATAVAALFGGPLLAGLFGEAYRIGALALAVLLAATTVHALGLLRLHHFLGVGEPAAASQAQVVALVLTVAGVAALIPRFGLTGAAMATLVAYLGFAGYLFRRSAPTPVDRAPVAERTVS